MRGKGKKLDKEGLQGLAIKSHQLSAPPPSQTLEKMISPLVSWCFADEFMLCYGLFKDVI